MSATPPSLPPTPHAPAGATPPATGPSRVGAVILTGGSAVRLDGADKAGLEIDGVTLLERALHATLGCPEVVVVGSEVTTSRPVTWTREDPAGGGPAAGLLAGLRRFAVRPDLVFVLAVDMPRVEPGTVARLVWAAERGGDGAVLVDQTGRRQPLCAAYRVEALDRVSPAEPADEHGLPMRRLVEGLTLTEVPSVGREARDVDTWEDLHDLRS